MDHEYLQIICALECPEHVLNLFLLFFLNPIRNVI